MLYALNVFDIVPGKEAVYRDYSLKAGRIIYGLGGRVISRGQGPETLRGELGRGCFVLVEFLSREVFRKFHDAATEQDIHRLRETSTQNYIWQLFPPWDLKAGVHASTPELPASAE